MKKINKILALIKTKKILFFAPLFLLVWKNYKIKEKHNYNFKLNNFAVLFFFIPLLLSLMIIFFLSQSTDLLANFVSDRSEGVIPERENFAQNLPSGDLTTEFLPAAIKIILNLVALTTTVMIIYSGILFITHFGEEDRLTKAKKILYWGVMGIGFIIFSYAIVWGITHISFHRIE